MGLASAAACTSTSHTYTTFVHSYVLVLGSWVYVYRTSVHVRTCTGTCTCTSVRTGQSVLYMPLDRLALRHLLVRSGCASVTWQLSMGSWVRDPVMGHVGIFCDWMRSRPPLVRFEVCGEEFRASRSPTSSSILHLVMRHLRFILVRACALRARVVPIWGGCEHAALVLNGPCFSSSLY